MLVFHYCDKKNLKQTNLKERQVYFRSQFLLRELGYLIAGRQRRLLASWLMGSTRQRGRGGVSLLRAQLHDLTSSGKPRLLKGLPPHNRATGGNQAFETQATEGHAKQTIAVSLFSAEISLTFFSIPGAFPI